MLLDVSSANAVKLAVVAESVGTFLDCLSFGRAIPQGLKEAFPIVGRSGSKVAKGCEEQLLLDGVVIRNVEEYVGFRQAPCA